MVCHVISHSKVIIYRANSYATSTTYITSSYRFKNRPSLPFCSDVISFSALYHLCRPPFHHHHPILQTKIVKRKNISSSNECHEALLQSKLQTGQMHGIHALLSVLRLQVLWCGGVILSFQLLQLTALPATVVWLS